nr:nucleotidyl transferase AbiEii/AbiGii toxin family protein [Bacteroidota bacterium]
MIDKQSLTFEWIDSKRKAYKKADPSIMERMIFAFYLLEQLKLSGLDFVFKGGTSLVLLLSNAKRFSIDLDIILPVGTQQKDIEDFLANVVKDNIFLRFSLDEKRSYKEGIPKAHYKFIFNSFITNREQEILLDILFDDIYYPVVLEKPIKTDWIRQVGDHVTVITPDINAIAGDKLTAFAPATIGIPYGLDKQREIIKQLFDIGELFEVIDNIETVKSSFNKIVIAEITYQKNKNFTIADVLNDIIHTGLIIATRDNQPVTDKSKFKELAMGISQFRYFLYSGSFRIEDAQTASAKAAYLAAIIKTNYTGSILRFSNTLMKESSLILHPKYNFLNKKLKNVPGGCLFYWNEALKLLFPTQ